MRHLTIAAVIAAAAILSGCTSAMDKNSDPPDESEVTVEVLPAKELCAMVKPARVEKLFDITVEDGTAPESDGMNFSTCVYKAERDQPLRQVSTMVESLAKGSGGKAALDGSFAAPEGEPQDYEAVEGLGDLAGFGLDPRAPEDSKTYQLAVVDGDHSVRVFAEYAESEKAEVSVDQLRPLAEEVLDRWDRP